MRLDIYMGSEGGEISPSEVLRKLWKREQRPYKASEIGAEIEYNTGVCMPPQYIGNLLKENGGAQRVINEEICGWVPETDQLNPYTIC